MFEGAGDSPRWTAPTTMLAPARQVDAASARLAGRAHYRVANGASGEAIAAVWSANLIGDGPSARSQHPNRAMRRAFESAWRQFYSRWDIDGFDLCGLLTRVVRSLVISGEALLVMVTTARGRGLGRSPL